MPNRFKALGTSEENVLIGPTHFSGVDLRIAERESGEDTDEKRPFLCLGRAVGWTKDGKGLER